MNNLRKEEKINKKKGNENGENEMKKFREDLGAVRKKNKEKMKKFREDLEAVRKKNEENMKRLGKNLEVICKEDEENIKSSNKSFTSSMNYEKIKDDIDKKINEGNNLLENIVSGKKYDKKAAYEKVKLVRFTLKPERMKTAKRLCLSEHPFGTIKRAMGFDHFLLKGLEKVTGEFALMCLGYNIKVAKNLLGFEEMMKMMTNGTC